MAASNRRDVVLEQMLAQGYITQAIYEESVKQSLPAPADIQAPAGADASKASTPATSRAGCSSR